MTEMVKLILDNKTVFCLLHFLFAILIQIRLDFYNRNLNLNLTRL